MSDFLYLAGRYANINARPSSTLTCSPAASTSGPATALGDSDPSTPLIFGSLAADSCGILNCAVNGGFEDGIGGWTAADSGTGSSAITLVAGEFRTGANGLKCIAGTGRGARYREFQVAAGESIYFSVWAKINAAPDLAEVYIENLTTGYALNASGVWVSGVGLASPAFSSSGAGGTFVQKSRTFTVQTYDVSRSDWHTIRVYLVGAANTVYFDDLEFSPGVTFASIHGHNLGPAMVPTIQSSDDASAWTTRATMTPRAGGFFSKFSVIYANYWRIKIDGASSITNPATPYIGEWVLGQCQTSAAKPRWDPAVDREFAGSRQLGTTGRHTAYNWVKDPRLSIGMTFLAENAAAELDLYDHLWLRSEQGRYPSILVPRDDETAVYYGHLMEPYSSSRPFGDARPTSLYLSGAALPTVGL